MQLIRPWVSRRPMREALWKLVQVCQFDPRICLAFEAGAAGEGSAYQLPQPRFTNG